MNLPSRASSPHRARTRSFAGLAGAVLLGLGLSPPRPHQDAPAAREQGLEQALAAVLEPILLSYRRTPQRRAAPRRPKRYSEVRDGWVTKSSVEIFEFLNPELFTGGQAPQEDQLASAVHAILDTQRQLDEHGIELLVVPIPDRINVHPDALAEVELGPSFTGFAPGLQRFIELLRDEGVEVLDLLPRLTAERVAFDAPQDDLVFMRMNAHWTPNGSALGAQAIAQAIRARPWFEPLAERTSRLESLRATWVPDGEQLPEGVAPPTLEFERVVDAAGALVERKDAHSSVVLWGDSFTSIYQVEGADLARRLHHALGRPVDVIAIKGGGPDATRKAFARRDAALEGKRLVVWTFASRSLVKARWQTVELQRP